MNGAQLFKVQGDSSKLMNGPPARESEALQTRTDIGPYQ
jgi:hypothetical protein